MLLENNEQALLSCLLKNGELIKETILNREHFGYVPHQRIFNAMRNLEEKEIPIDIVSVNTEVGQEILFIGGSEYLGDLYSLITSEVNLKTYERFVLEEFKIRKTKELLTQLELVQTPRDLEKLQQVILEVNNLLEQNQEHEFNLIETLVELNNDVESIKGEVNGIATGYTELDLLLDGLDKEELIILAARPSVGKTAFALGITTNVCQSANHFVNFFSLEMSDKSLLSRMICSIGNIHSMKIKNAHARFDATDWNKYQNAQGIISGFKENLAIYDNSKVTVQEIRAKVKQNIRNHPDKKNLVVIDYLSLIQGTGRKERHLEIGEITRNLKRLARELKVSVLLLAQLSRSVEQRQNKRPMLSDLRDSGEIEQDADKILFLYRDDYYDKESENKNIIEVIAAKNRNGALGTVSLAFVKEYNKFVNLERRFDGDN
jgi:replicative DNA helicase